MFCFQGENLSQRLLMRRFFAFCSRGKDTTQTDSLHLVYLESVMFRDAYYLYPRVVGGGWRIFFWGGVVTWVFRGYGRRMVAANGL